MDIFSKADKQGQAKVVDQLYKIFSGQTLTVDQHYIDKSTVDIYVTATTKTNKSYLYVFEVKDRNFEHTKYSDCFLDVDKLNELRKREGYRQMYVHTFTDDWISIWDIGKIDFSMYEPKAITRGKYTVIPSEKVVRNSYLIPDTECVYSNSFIV